MAFSWGGHSEGDNHHHQEGESPASSGSGGAASGRGFWLGGEGNSDRSEDESEAGYGLFSNNDYGGFSAASRGPGGAPAGEGLSMDFWSIEDVKPMNLGATAAGSVNSMGSYEDPLLKARREMLLGSSPDAAMETFDDLAGFGTAA